MKPTSAISLLYVPRARGSLQTRFFCLANFWCFQKEVNQSIENKTDNLVQQITSKTNTKTSFFSQVHLVFLLNQVRTDDVKKNNLTFIEGLESLVYRAWFTLFPHIEWRTIKLQYTAYKMVQKSGLKCCFISSNRPTFKIGQN